MRPGARRRPTDDGLRRLASAAHKVLRKVLQSRVLPRLAAGLAVAALILVLQAVLGRARGVDEDAWRQRVEADYVATWAELDRVAEATAADVAALLAGDLARDASREVDRLALFRRLAPRSRRASVTLLLLDPDREAVAWTGEGLLHEPPGWDLPDTGHAVRRGATATTLVTVRQVDDSRRPWRIVAGRSLASRPFPFDDLPLASPLRWSVQALSEPGEDADPRVWRLGTDLEYMLVVDAGAEPLRRAHTASRWLQIALALVLVITLWSAALASGWRRPAWTALLVALGAGLPSALLGAAPWSAVALASAAAVIVLRVGHPDFVLPGARNSPRLVQLWAVVGFLAYSAGVWWTQDRLGPVDLSVGLTWDGLGSASITSFAWLLATCGWLLALLGFTADARAGSDVDAEAGGAAQAAEPDVPGWAAALLVLLAGAFLDSPWLAWGLGGLSSALAARWWSARRRSGLAGRGALAGLALLAALLAAVGWQSGMRLVFRDAAPDYLPRLQPPTLEELNELLVELHDHFDGFDVTPYLPPAAAGTSPEAELEDLAFALWQDSPLSRRDGLSALTVVPSRDAEPGGVPSTFAFGLALGPSGPTPQPARWPMPRADAWADALSGGAGFLWSGDRPWGEVTYWLQPRPGFRLAADEGDELQANLVRGGPRRRAADGLPDPLQYALYDFEGRALSSPWTEAPPLPQPLLERMLDHEGIWSSQVTTPDDGLSRVWLRIGPDGVETLYLPRLGLRGGLEKVGSQALASLVLLGLLALASLVSAVTRQRFRIWLDDVLRSYSKRMILVYTALLLLPLVALNLVLLRGFGERLRAEQVEGAEDAVASARSLVVDYLSGLEPGFLFETQVNRELLEWISGLVGHQVNLYWGSRVFASSQQELFTAGLLPRRIPGEVYSRLALSSYKMGFRQHRGDLGYLELYAPIDVGGTGALRQGFFLSVPLLEEEEEVARELAALKRRAVLVTRRW